MRMIIERRVLSGEHSAILELATEILGTIAQRDFDEIAVIKLRWRLAHGLAVHLAKEDKIIYPRLKQHPDAQIAELARRYESEMGGLSEQYQKYMTAWTGESIRNDREAFRAETRQILSVLARRVDKEEAELYPMYEASTADKGCADSGIVRPFARSA
jgi:hemerythrin-like domain-containing protein